MSKLRPQRWQIATPDSEATQQLATSLQLDPLITQVLVNRGIQTSEQAALYLNPDLEQLPDPSDVFVDLSSCVERLEQAIQEQQAIAICGDYDADGMTSTALLMRTLRQVQARVSYEIPSRLTEGYGINERIVSDLHERGVSVIITVDNGIAAVAPIQLAKSLGLSVIVTDHHDIPTQLPPADAILNPKLIPESSPYRGIAGVGVAYLLALALTDRLGSRAQLERSLLELLTLGTIADLAPLTGINRRWVKQGLHLLPTSQVLGIRALLEITGLDRQQSLSPEAIGFGLGPRINAVGRLAQPRVVIELLTTDDPEMARQCAADCERLNQERQQLCQAIEGEAIQQIEQEGWNPEQERILVVLGQGWHHGVIGIVASRLVERYGAPVFIGSQEGEEIRGSVRGIPEFNVFEALEHCGDLFLKFGGHPAAGGFSMKAAQWTVLHQRLTALAQSLLDPDLIQPLVVIDVKASLTAMTLPTFQQIQTLQPCGIGNPEPVFWSQHLQVVKQKLFGQDQSHLKVQLRHSQHQRALSAILWRGAQYHPLPDWIDLAYVLRAKEYRGEVEMELEVKGIRPADPDGQLALMTDDTPDSAPQPSGDRSPSLIYKSAPPLSCSVVWHDGAQLSTLLPQWQGSWLIYGYRRPQIPQDYLTNLEFHYDRPQAGCRYDGILLWSWPPSITHLNWLLATISPTQASHTVYVQGQTVPLISADSLRRQLKTYLVTHDCIDLLRLGQQWWLAPSTVVAGLRSIGFSCPQFGQTASLEEELLKLERWFNSTWSSMAALEGFGANR